MSRRLRAAAGLVALAFLVSACGGSSNDVASEPPASPTRTATTSGTSYVALGDSYTAAPYVYLTDVAGGCLRSNGNYPNLLAKAIGATLTDVSCSGAQTKDIADPQSTFGGEQVPPQLAAVSAETQLVTVGIGGNDFGLFGSLSSGCPITGPGGQAFGSPAPAAGGSCGDVNTETAKKSLAGIGTNVRKVLAEIRDRAPDARIVLVGYPRIASTTTTCPTLLPATLANAQQVDAVTSGLDVTLRAAAKAGGATYIDMYDASRGHDVCAGKAAWVNGVATDTERAAPLHPFAEEQQAVATLIEKALAG